MILRETSSRLLEESYQGQPSAFLTLVAVFTIDLFNSRRHFDEFEEPFSAPEPARQLRDGKMPVTATQKRTTKKGCMLLTG